MNWFLSFYENSKQLETKTVACSKEDDFETLRDLTKLCKIKMEDVHANFFCDRQSKNFQLV